MGRYERYLDRLQKRLDDEYILAAAQKRLRYMKSDYDQYGNKLEQSLKKEGMPAATMAAVSEKQQQDWLKTSSRIYNEAELQELNRRKGIADQMDEVKFQQDEYRRQKRKQEKQHEGFTLRSIAQGVGAVAGFVAGGPGGAMAGANLAGGVADMAVGLDKSYDSPELIMEGIGNTLQGVMQTSNLIEDHKYADFLSGSQKNIMSLADEMSDKEFIYFLDTMEKDQQMMSFKDFAEKYEYLFDDGSM